MKRTKVLIIDDSAIMRQFLTDVLSSSRSIEVIGTAMNLEFAQQKILRLRPDIITLDVGMADNGCRDFLTQLMATHPVPIIVVSGLSEKSSLQSIQAMGLGAVDYVLKPTYEEISTSSSLIQFTQELISKVLIVSKSKITKKKKSRIPAPGRKIDLSQKVSNTIIAIGASAGGVETITHIISNLKETVPGIVIVQHMPKEFTKAFADSVNKQSALLVREARNADRIYHGTVSIAPGNRHIVLSRDSHSYYITENNEKPYNRHKPSVDILFNSVAETAGKDAVGILLTGMGDDGARGLLRMKESGAMTIAQDKKSSIIFGMPMAAIEINAATRICNTDTIINYLNQL